MQEERKHENAYKICQGPIHDHVSGHCKKAPNSIIHFYFNVQWFLLHENELYFCETLNLEEQMKSCELLVFFCWWVGESIAPT